MRGYGLRGRAKRLEGKPRDLGVLDADDPAGEVGRIGERACVTPSSARIGPGRIPIPSRSSSSTPASISSRCPPRRLAAAGRASRPGRARQAPGSPRRRACRRPVRRPRPDRPCRPSHPRSFPPRTWDAPPARQLSRNSIRSAPLESRATSSTNARSCSGCPPPIALAIVRTTGWPALVPPAAPPALSQVRAAAGGKHEGKREGRQRDPGPPDDSCRRHVVPPFRRCVRRYDGALLGTSGRSRDCSIEASGLALGSHKGRPRWPCPRPFARHNDVGAGRGPPLPFPRSAVLTRLAARAR